ncbi:MAG: hypothetical protein Q9M10_00680, partial [Mariprofundaceae bacterium]|nr:hypothetical protein [Mariprofundaceae bacterium]
QDYQLEIGAGLGVMAGKVWRIGLMGYACRKDNVLTCVSALAEVLNRLNNPTITHQESMAATLAAYGE